MTNPFHGFQLIESHLMVETYQYRFPRTKKRHIKNKWKKRTNNFKTRPRKDFLLYGNNIVCHPIMRQKLLDKMVDLPASHDKLINENFWSLLT